MYWFTADEHYGHENILRYLKRPFRDVEDMSDQLINNHNSLVGKGDCVIHAGDFCWYKAQYAKSIIGRLNGTHIFLKGSHDWWLKGSDLSRWSKQIGDHYVTADHYAGLSWPRSHHNAWQVFGHSHGALTPQAKQYDVGVDNNNFFPISFNQLVEIMAGKPDNPAYTILQERKKKDELR